ncbi:hypothetical protein, partial [uncultured Thiohalocapsa sp.]|uniref:hypothetical protein n=1 Tax=uncultured Thiohalocapsa sp. TaxID=768990 RepID=UPI0025E9C403
SPHCPRNSPFLQWRKPCRPDAKYKTWPFASHLTFWPTALDRTRAIRGTSPIFPLDVENAIDHGTEIMFKWATLGSGLNLRKEWADDILFRIGDVAVVALARWMLL